MKTIELTKEGHGVLQNELKELQEAKRPLTVDKLQKARSMGDLKENNAYQSAREELSTIDGRILEIQYIIKYARISETSSNTSQIALGNTIEVDTNGASRTFKIVGEYEADPMNGKISATSPIGKALIGTKAGMSVKVSTPTGIIVYKILSIT